MGVARVDTAEHSCERPLPKKPQGGRPFRFCPDSADEPGASCLELDKRERGALERAGLGELVAAFRTDRNALLAGLQPMLGPLRALEERLAQIEQAAIAAPPRLIRRSCAPRPPSAPPNAPPVRPSSTPPVPWSCASRLSPTATTRSRVRRRPSPTARRPAARPTPPSPGRSRPRTPAARPRPSPRNARGSLSPRNSAASLPSARPPTARAGHRPHRGAGRGQPRPGPPAGGAPRTDDRGGRQPRSYFVGRGAIG